MSFGDLDDNWQDGYEEGRTEGYDEGYSDAEREYHGLERERDDLHYALRTVLTDLGKVNPFTQSQDDVEQQLAEVVEYLRDRV